jgi:hypothetical protein
VPTPVSTDNSTLVATTAFVKTAVGASAAAGTYGTAVVGYNATTASWPARPTVTGPVLWISTNSSTAARPSDMAIGDAWMQNPDSATA